MTESQAQDLIDAVRGIESEDSTHDYRDHLNAIEWNLSEMRHSLKSIAESLATIANK